jgi:hypothetical protein
MSSLIKFILLLLVGFSTTHAHSYVTTTEKLRQFCEKIQKEFGTRNKDIIVEDFFSAQSHIILNLSFKQIACTYDGNFAVIKIVRILPQAELSPSFTIKLDQSTNKAKIVLDEDSCSDQQVKFNQKLYSAIFGIEMDSYVLQEFRKYTDNEVCPKIRADLLGILRKFFSI